MIDRIEYLAQMGRLRLTPPALAKKAGVSVNTVRNFLSGGDIRLGHLEAISEALGGSLDTTFTQVQRPTKSPSPPVAEAQVVKSQDVV